MENEGQELETFLSNRDKRFSQVVKDLDSRAKRASGSWDPFKERNIENATTDGETLTHLLKCCLGTGILAMPYAFKMSGLSFGILLMLFVSVICTYGAYVLVKCAHELYRRTRVTTLTFPEVGEAAFANGPPWGRKYAKMARWFIVCGIFAAYFGSCSVYAVIMTENFREVAAEYGLEINQRVAIASMLVPLVLLTYIPSLKALTPVSMIANIFMGVGISITFYFITDDLGSPWDRPQIGEIRNFPQFFSITIFAMEAIGVVMPLENSMKTPQHMIGIFGVLNIGAVCVTLIYILLGFIGYIKFQDPAASITLSLPPGNIAAQAVKILIGLAVFCTFSLSYFISLQVAWNPLKNRIKKNQKLYEYLFRTFLTTVSVLIAVAVPTIGPFLGLIGALCFATLGLIMPAFIYLVTFWEQESRFLLFLKSSVLIVFGLIAFIFGTKTSIEDIVKVYLTNEDEIKSALNATLT